MTHIVISSRCLLPSHRAAAYHVTFGSRVLRQHLKVAPFTVQGGTLVAPQPLVALFQLESWNGGPFFFCRAINTAESTAVKKIYIL